MIINLKNKDTLQVDEFHFRCSIGKKGLSQEKLEGDLKTPKGLYQFNTLYFRSDRLEKPKTKLNVIKIKENMGWCNDIRYPKKYNKLIKISKKVSHEKMFRFDKKYDFVIPIKYNYKNPIINKGSAIFFHLSNSYKPTAGCIALNLNDFLIFLKLLDKENKIKIY